MKVMANEWELDFSAIVMPLPFGTPHSPKRYEDCGRTTFLAFF